jgi:hypothetical protein
VSRTDALILRTAAVWTVFVWVTRIRNVLGDDTPGHGFAFKAVHVVLAIVSVAFAVATWAVASRNRKRSRDRAETHS